MTPAAGLDPARLKVIYEIDAERYLRSLPLEHFMEATAQATQRKITLESFDLVAAARPDVHVFNELLIQYPVPGQHPTRPARVVPDNMVVVHPAPLDVAGSFMTPLQPVGPLLVLEYVSKSNPRKDYEDNHARYERDLRVPYYLLFYPDADELTVFRLAGERYESVKPNDAGRLAVPELELQVALLDGWVRYWFRGELLPLPGELLGQLNAVRVELVAERAARLAAERERDAERRRAEAAEAELARLRDELDRTKGVG
ncbi:MAG: Uma2 family endonuclease [Gemmataceae bacterium]|nr:Uma2 family endonuclease [Gemmataceae bacterium]